MKGYRTIISAVALALWKAGVAFGWWPAEPEIAEGIAHLLVALVVIFGALKVNRLIDRIP